MRTSLILLSVVLLAQQVAPQSPSIYQRQTTIKALIIGSPGLRDGGYQASGTSSICGVIPKEASLTGEAVFVVEFPSETPRETPGSITSIAFGSSELAATARRRQPCCGSMDSSSRNDRRCDGSRIRWRWMELIL